jgi:hypothetical protein
VEPLPAKVIQAMTKMGTIFSEILKLAPRRHFDKVVERHKGRPLRQVVHRMETVYHAYVRADNRRDWRIFEELFHLSLAHIKCQSKYAGGMLELSRVIRETLMNRMSLSDILTARPERLTKIGNRACTGYAILTGQ